MQVKKADIDKIFSKLNLEVRSTKHRYGWLLYEGRKILRVHYSHGKGSLPGKISDKIRSQLRLSSDEFKRLISCPLTMEGYISLLDKKGLLKAIHT